jgi:alpha-1,6-mannosyltransferase
MVRVMEPRVGGSVAATGAGSTRAEPPAAGQPPTAPHPEAAITSTPVTEPAGSAADPTADPARPGRWERFGSPPRGPLLTGLVAALLMVVGGYGAGGVLVTDPLLTDSPLGFWRYGHGRELASTMIYVGVALMIWAWVRLGREVLAERVGGRAVVATAAVWTVPMLFSVPLFTRDIYSYLAQGTLPLRGFDPYEYGPEVMSDVVSDNVHYFWQDTPAPYGPLFILVAKGVAAVVGDNMIAGVVLMRLALLPGAVLLVWALPELTRRLGGRVPVALWVAVANPMMVIHMIGGGHNDLLVVGLLPAAAVVALRGRPATAIAIATAAMAVKASAAIALPFLVLVWAGQLSGSRTRRILVAGAAGIGVFVAVFGAITLVAGVDLGWLPALSAPSMIVNWMSLPTAVGLVLAGIASWFGDVPAQPFIDGARIVGAAVLLVLSVRQWWAARDGGPDAIRRAGVVLLLVAVLSPAMLPWYVSWGMALFAATAWSRRGLVAVVVISSMLLIVYYPNGEDALKDWGYLALCLGLSALAAWSLLRPDPLGLRARTGRTPLPEVSGAGRGV